MGGPAWSKDWIGFYNELLSAFFNGIGQKTTSQGDRHMSALPQNSDITDFMGTRPTPRFLRALWIMLGQRDLLIGVLKLLRNFSTLFFADVLELPEPLASLVAKHFSRPPGLLPPPTRRVALPRPNEGRGDGWNGKGVRTTGT